jgi:hypothetical protein
MKKSVDRIHQSDIMAPLSTATATAKGDYDNAAINFQRTDFDVC